MGVEFDEVIEYPVRFETKIPAIEASKQFVQKGFTAENQTRATCPGEHIEILFGGVEPKQRAQGPTFCHQHIFIMNISVI